MKFKHFLTTASIILTLFTSLVIASENMNWDGLTKEKIALKLPLIIIKGTKGFLACGYVNVETCNKIDEACAIVSGVNTHDDMLQAKIKLVSDKAKELGIKEGMTGSEAVELMR
jgi:uncharacterized protein YunC (DUF1805 family)